MPEHFHGAMDEFFPDRAIYYTYYLIRNNGEREMVSKADASDKTAQLNAQTEMFKLIRSDNGFVAFEITQTCTSCWHTGRAWLADKSGGIRLEKIAKGE